MSDDLDTAGGGTAFTDALHAARALLDRNGYAVLPWKPAATPWLEAERAVLGCALVSGKAVRELVEYLQADDFEDPVHAMLFTTISEMHADGAPVDVVTLSAALDTKGHLDRVGGFLFVAALPSSVTTGENVRIHARFIIEHRITARIGTVAASIGEDAKEPGDAHEFARNARARIVKITSDERLASMSRVPFAKSFNEFVQQFYSTGTGPTVIPVQSGIGGLDVAISGGFWPGTVSIIGGRPHMGKSAFCKTVVANACARGEPALVCSLEESQADYFARVLAGEARIENRRLRTDKLSEDEVRRVRDCTDAILSWPLVFTDETPMGHADVRAEVERAKTIYPNLRLVVVDHIGHMREPGNWRGNRNGELEESVNGLMGIAKKFDVAVIAAAQLNREVEKRPDPRPSLSDLRDCGALEQTARLVLFPFRPGYYDPKNVAPDVAEILVSKVSNGQPTSVDVRFEDRFVRFVGIGE